MPDEPEEFGETAPAFEVLPQPAKVNGHDVEAELIHAVIADSTGDAFERCRDLLPARAFHGDEPRRIWSALQAGKTLDEPAAFAQAAKITINRFVELTIADPLSGVWLDVRLQKMRERWQRDQIEALALEMSKADGVQLAEWIRRMEAIGGAAVAKEPASITTFHYPADADPNILLGSDDYLGRGGGLLFISHAGAGKSSWVLDACMTWALGVPWMGIRPAKPLKTLVIQAEDSDRYLGKLFSSFAHVRGLGEPESAQLGENCLVLRLKGVAGPEFFRQLQQLTAKHKPDLVVINPIYLYAEGDIARSEFAQPFLLALDKVNKDEKFAYILVHHTGKPAAKDKSGARAQVADWESIYMGFGSSYFANWPRCSILLEPRGEAGKYTIKLGKGGLNAGVVREVEQGAGKRWEPVTRIGIKHSEQKMKVGAKERPVIYWEIDDKFDASAANNDSCGTGGRSSKSNFEDYSPIFPTTKAEAKPTSQLFKLAQTKEGVSRAAFFKAMKRWREDGLIAIDDTNPAAPRFYLNRP